MIIFCTSSNILWLIIKTWFTSFKGMWSCEKGKNKLDKINSECYTRHNNGRVSIELVKSSLKIVIIWLPLIINVKICPTSSLSSALYVYNIRKLCMMLLASCFFSILTSPSVCHSLNNCMSQPFTKGTVIEWELADVYVHVLYSYINC